MIAQTPEKPAPLFRGDVGVFGPRDFRGWAFLPLQPDAHLRVQVKIGDDVIGEGVADQFRADLLTAGIGKGDHAFHIPIRELAPDESLSLASVCIEVGKVWHVLALPPLSMPRDPALQIPEYDGSRGASPLFIVGSPRSGTSALVVGVRACGYYGYNEGNFLGLIEPINHALWTHFQGLRTTDERVMMSHIDETRMRNEIFGMMKRIVDGLNRRSPWLDKTGNPNMILSLPLICKLWPGCRIVFAKRRGIENIVSRLKKFPEREFEYHCADWARNMNLWRSVRGRLDPAVWLEVDQHDMAARPFEVAAELSKLLKVAPEMQTRMALAFAHERPQETRPGTAKGTLDIVEVGWTTDQMEVFHQLCGPEMEAYGYSYGRDYWGAAAA